MSTMSDCDDSHIHRTPKSEGQRAKDVFRCDECGHVALRSLAEFLELGWTEAYEHCGELMELVSADEAERVRAKR